LKRIITVELTETEMVVYSTDGLLVQQIDNLVNLAQEMLNSKDLVANAQKGNAIGANLYIERKKA